MTRGETRTSKCPMNAVVHNGIHSLLNLGWNSPAIESKVHYKNSFHTFTFNGFYLTLGLYWRGDSKMESWIR